MKKCKDHDWQPENGWNFDMMACTRCGQWKKDEKD